VTSRTQPCLRAAMVTCFLDLLQTKNTCIMNSSVTQTGIRWISPVLILVFALIVPGCDGLADLDVDNKNAPDRSEALANPGDVVSLLSGGYRTFYQAIYGDSGGNRSFYAPGPHLDGFADAQTMTNAFASLWTPSKEPKVRIQNTLASSFVSNMIEPVWGPLNASLSTANDVIVQIENQDLEIRVDGSDQTQKVLAAAYLLRGWSHGRLANMFNKSYILTKDTDVANLQFSKYPAVANRAVKDFERAIEIANNNSFTLNQFLPWTSGVSSAEFSKIANTLAARVAVSNSRTASENSDLSSVDGYGWGDVLSFTQNGVDQTISLTLDGFAGDWIDSYQYLSVRVKWYYRVDNRLINLMDSSYPVKYPTTAAENGTVMPMAESNDQRLCTTPTTGAGPPPPDADYEPEGCYFAHVTDLSFYTVSRGPRLFSNYWWARPFALPQGSGSTTPFGASPRPFFLPVENNTMMAEAMIRANGNVSGAQSIINSGTRVENGGLDPLSGADQEEVLNAIFYERDLELYRMVHGQSYYDLRRRGAMQAGTPLHLPVPASELQTVQADLYTFGGAGFAGDPGTASGDQAWCEPVNGNVTSTGNVSPNGCTGPYSVPSGNALEANQGDGGVQPARAKTQ
jgi:hypothetical protein